MIVLALGVLLLALQHLVVAVPALKRRLKQRIGERAFGAGFGVTSLAGIAVIVLGWRMSDFVAVYDPPVWGRHVDYGLTLIAFICLGIFLFRGSLRQTLRFPMAIAAICWAIGHLFANGDMRSLILFGGILAYGLAHLLVGLGNGVRPSPEVRGGHNLMSILSGVALYGVMTQLHPILIGVPVFSLGG